MQVPECKPTLCLRLRICIPFKRMHGFQVPGYKADLSSSIDSERVPVLCCNRHSRWVVCIQKIAEWHSFWSCYLTENHGEFDVGHTRLLNAGVRLNKAKCKFFQSSVVYLGHMIDGEGLHPTQELFGMLPGPKT